MRIKRLYAGVISYFKKKRGRNCRTVKELQQKRDSGGRIYIGRGGWRFPKRPNPEQEALDQISTP